jgi:integrase
MRRGEILGLKWRDCDFRRNIIYLLDTKNGEKREVPMNEPVKTALIRVRRNPKSDYIFCHKEGAQIKDIKKSFLTALRKSAIKDFRFHDLLVKKIDTFWTPASKIENHQNLDRSQHIQSLTNLRT